MGVLRSATEITALTQGPKNHFFGDYGRSPWCPGDQRVLALRTELYDRAPGPDDVADVGYIEMGHPGEFIPVSSTRAWNWQRGSMQRWVVRGDREWIIHNSRREGRFAGCLVDLADGSKTYLPRSIFDVDSSGRYALSLNFARLHELRPGYGFAGTDDEYRNVLASEDDGVFRVDLSTHEHQLLLPLKQIAEFRPPAQTTGAKHWVNDLVFAPAAEKFCFLHRCWMPDGNIMSRLMAADANGDGLRVLYDGSVSHFAWRDDDTILAWGGRRRLLDTMRSKGSLLRQVLRLAKPLYHLLGEPKLLKNKLLKESYLLIHDHGGEPEKTMCQGLYQDGHCSFDQSGECFITDTYPDRKGRMSLLMCHPQTGAVVEVAVLDSDLALKGEFRCDLHPRWSHNARLVCIDSTHCGQRQMYVADISSLRNKPETAELSRGEQ